MNRQIPTLVLTVLAGLAGHASAQCASLSLTPPTLDRWMYPFNSTPGVETSASTFGAIAQAGFDDRDAQVMLGWDTDRFIPTDLGVSSYSIRTARVTIWISVSDRFYYDPSPDVVSSLYTLTDPEYTPDADLGRPVELYGVGWRNGQSSATFTEFTPLSPFPPFPLQEGVRSGFAAVFDSAGVATDISRQVRQRFNTNPMAIGLIPGAAAGDRPVAGTAMVFDLDLSVSATRDYLASCVNSGRVRLMVTSLEPASGGPGGGTGTPSYPAFYMKENLISPGYAARLDLDVTILPELDMNMDGSVDQDDVRTLINIVAGGFEPMTVSPDLNFDGNVDQDDVRVLVNAVAGGGFDCP